MDTQTQIDRLIELAIIQRSELKQLVEQLPQLREHLNAEVEKVFDETEPQLRAELEEWTTKQTADKTAALGVALEAKIADLAKSLEVSTQARYNAIIAEREENARLAAQAEAKIAEHAASLPGAVKEIVSAELARFPRAGEIDQLRKEFAEPRGLNPRGKWQAGETYNKLDLVTINGDSYTSNTDGNRTRPSRSSADWTLVAARGTGGGGGPTSLSELTTVPSDGDLLIGSGTSWVTSNLTAGAGISITVGPGAITISATDGDITLDDGTAASPSLHFTNDPDTGIYRPAANTLGISVSGTQVAYFDENGLTVPSAGVVAGGSIHAGNGNANNPSLSFDGDQDTGFFRHQANEIGIALGGTQYATLTSTTFSITPVVTMASSLRVNGTTDSSNKDTGAIVTEGGLGVEKSASIGGNLTVSGTGSFGGATGPHTFGNGAGAVEVRAVGDSSGYYGYSFYTGGSYESSLKHTAGSGILKLDVGRNSAWGGTFEIYADTTRAARFAKTSTTLDGNLTVSGTGTSSFAGSLRVSAATAISKLTVGDTSNTFSAFIFGNNSANGIAFGTSGTGVPVINGYNNTFAATQTIAVQPNGGNVLIGSTADGGQKLQVAGDLAANVGNGTSSALQLNQSGQVNWYVRNVATTGVLSIGNGGGDYLTFPKTSGTATLSNQVSTLSLSSTVASSSTTTGALVVSGGVGVAGAINAGGNLTVSGGTATISAASAQATLNLTSSGGSGRQYQLFSDATGQAGIFDATGSTFPLLITTTTLSTARNLTVSGTGTSSFAGSVTIANTASTSSYQTGLRLQSTAGSAPNTIQALEFYSSSLSTALGAIDALREAGSFASSLRFYSTTSGGALTERGRFNSSGNFLLGTTTDGGQKLQVAGTGYLSDSLRVGTSFTPVAWGVKAIEVNDAGGGLFAVYYGGAAKGYLLAESGGISLTAQGSGAVRLNAGTGNFLFGSSASAGTSAVGVLAIANATAPTSSPAGGGQLYVESGALKYRGSSGTVTTIANA